MSRGNFGENVLDPTSAHRHVPCRSDCFLEALCMCLLAYIPTDTRFISSTHCIDLFAVLSVSAEYIVQQRENRHF